ncbi:MAG TPA: NAD(P)-dependent oxidoreductase, partial [Dehalococcoidia bacterium]
MAEPIAVVVCAPLIGRDLTPIRALEPSIRLIDGNDAFDAYNQSLRQGDQDAIAAKRRELDALLAQAEVLCLSIPVLREIVTQAPKLHWLHHTQAGVSNLWATDVWAMEDVVLTSGRGHVRPTAMAEYAIAGALTFARGLHDAYLDKPNGRLDRSHYAPVRIEGSTMGIVGLGGIGSEVARLAKALGMRVIATKRTTDGDAPNVDVLLPPSGVKQMAAESDFIVLSTQLTQETLKLIDADVLAVMKPSAVLVNVSRGEVIDEDAMFEALRTGKLRGAVVDVFDGELDGKPPRPEFFTLPNAVLTPHISTGGTVNDT